jgi:hypothetical protein
MQENALHEVVATSHRSTELPNNNRFALSALSLNPIDHSGTAARVMHFLMFVCTDVRSTAMHVLAL